MNLQPMIDFIKDFTSRGAQVLLKADGSTPAYLRGIKEWQKDEEVRQYLLKELELSNFTDTVKRKGYGSIYLTTPYAERVLHARFFAVFGGEFEVQYLD